jgi:predicted dehydrogenase
MESRRKFLQLSAAALTAAAAKPLMGSGIQGANNRIRMAIIGTGNRGGRVFDSLSRHTDCQFLAAAEVNKAKLDQWMTPARQTFNLQVYGDYRRILDRRDVDAVLIATPDHWHSQQMIDAVSAGKDVYVEKPASNTIARVNAMLDAYKKGKQVVQVGTQQRSWDHFQEAKAFLDGGTLGTISHVVIVQPGSYARSKEPEQPVPTGLDWEGFQGPAPRKAFKPSRLAWRGWYDYGGGLVADWGAHHVDVAHWFMNADGKFPLRTSATGAFFAVSDADPEQVQDTFSIAWQYDNFIMTFANAEVYMDPATENKLENWGVFFIGARGSLQVNRQGWAVRPVVPHVIRKQGAPPPPTAGGATLGAGGAAIAPGGAPAGAPGAQGAPGGGRGGRGGGGGRGGNNAAPVEAKLYINPRGGVEEDYPLDVHTRNFLDCVKSRKAPNAHMEIGYHSALPCLLALESLKEGKPLGWDAASMKSKTL